MFVCLSCLLYKVPGLRRNVSIRVLCYALEVALDLRQLERWVWLIEDWQLLHHVVLVLVEHRVELRCWSCMSLVYQLIRRWIVVTSKVRASGR